MDGYLHLDSSQYCRRHLTCDQLPSVPVCHNRSLFMTALGAPQGSLAVRASQVACRLHHQLLIIVRYAENALNSQWCMTHHMY